MIAPQSASDAGPHRQYVSIVDPEPLLLRSFKPRAATPPILNVFARALNNSSEYRISHTDEAGSRGRLTDENSIGRERRQTKHRSLEPNDDDAGAIEARGGGEGRRRGGAGRGRGGRPITRRHQRLVGGAGVGLGAPRDREVLIKMIMFAKV